MCNKEIETVHYNLESFTYEQLVERMEFSRAYANTMMMMAKIHQKQENNEESVKLCAKYGILCLKEYKRIKEYLDQDKTVEMLMAA